MECSHICNNLLDLFRALKREEILGIILIWNNILFFNFLKIFLLYFAYIIL